MRKHITIVGVGERRSGTSAKSGKPYDFTPVAFEYDDMYFIGKKCETANIDQNVLGSYVPAPGDQVEIVFHVSNFRTYIDAIL